jgi:hypothetical protein
VPPQRRRRGMLPVHHHRAPAGVSAAAAAEEDERGGGGPRWRPVRLRTCVVDPQNKPKTISILQQCAGSASSKDRYPQRRDGINAARTYIFQQRAVTSPHPSQGVGSRGRPEPLPPAPPAPPSPATASFFPGLLLLLPGRAPLTVELPARLARRRGEASLG